MSNSHQLMPERRRGIRILTLRNARNAGLVLLVLFVAISVTSELRDTTSGRYGRLYGKEIAKTASPLAATDEFPDVAPVEDATHADPLLVESAVREQYLGVDEPIQPPAPPAPVVTTPHATADVAITGGATGVVVQSKVGTEPVLTGGFGRPAQP